MILRMLRRSAAGLSLKPVGDTGFGPLLWRDATEPALEDGFKPSSTRADEPGRESASGLQKITLQLTTITGLKKKEKVSW